MKNSSQPFFSVLVPAYNADLFIDAAIKSVLAQTAGDWEIVAADDASTDGTMGRLESWGVRDARVRVFTNPANLGMTGNWNRCLREAKGEYVLKLDADDVLQPRTLEILAKPFERKDVVGAAVRSLLCTPDGSPFGAPPADAALAAAGIDPYADHDLLCSRWQEVAFGGHQLWSSSAFVARREWLASTGGWDERFGCAADTEMVLRLLRMDGTFCHRGYVGLHYRVVPGSVSDVYRREGWLQWEGLVVYLRNLVANSELLRRSRRARQRRVVLWRRWENRRCEESWRNDMPEAKRALLEEAMAGIAPPPLSDRALEVVFSTARELAPQA